MRQFRIAVVSAVLLAAVSASAGGNLIGSGNRDGGPTIGSGYRTEEGTESTTAGSASTTRVQTNDGSHTFGSGHRSGEDGGVTTTSGGRTGIVEYCVAVSFERMRLLVASLLR